MIPSPQTLPTTAPAMAPSDTRLEAVDAEAVDDDDAEAVEDADNVVEVADKISLLLSGVHMSIL